MFELVISTKNGKRYHANVNSWREASAELARFQQNDGILDAAVLSRAGDRVSRFNGRGLEMF